MDGTVADGRKIIHMEFGRFADALKFALSLNYTRRTKVHEFSYNATSAKKKKRSPNTGKAKIRWSASNTTYQHMLKREY